MNRLNPFIYFLLMLSFFACDKKADLYSSDEIYSNEPIFYCYANNEDFKIEAGNNGFYMFTDFEMEESTNVFRFIANFAKLPDCTSECEESLRIEIRKQQVTNPASEINFDSLLTSGNYAFAGTQSSGFDEVLIEYTNIEGIIYRSVLADQSTIGYFEILSVSDFQNNENGLPTKKLSVEFECELSRDAFEDFPNIIFLNAKAVISVAVPE